VLRKKKGKKMTNKRELTNGRLLKTNKKQQHLLSTMRGPRPIIEWLLYSIGLFALLVIVVGPLFAFGLKSDTSGITLVIAVIFFIMLIKNFLDARYIDCQIQIVDRQLSQLQEVKNIVRFLETSQKSLLYEHIHNLFKIFKRDVSISQDNLISLLQMKLLSRTRLTDFCSKVLVTLGLIGTIIGLIISSGGLGTVVESVGGDSNSLLAGMRKTIDGMGTAFYTTLFGAILGGVCLRLLGNLVDSHVDFLVSRIAEVTEIYILPVLRSGARVKDRMEQDKRVQQVIEESKEFEQL
jgi:hypothetical protein